MLFDALSVSEFETVGTALNMQLGHQPSTSRWMPGLEKSWSCQSLVGDLRDGEWV